MQFRLRKIVLIIEIRQDRVVVLFTGTLHRMRPRNFRISDVIPGVDQGIDRIAAFLRPLENVKKYELLPYHALGDAKRQAMGLPEAPFTVPTPERMKELNQYAFVR